MFFEEKKKTTARTVMKTTMILLVATLMLAGCKACHNSTSACHHNGKFERLDEKNEII